MEFLRNIEPYEAIGMADFIIHKSNRISSKALIDNDSIEIRFFSAAAGEEIDKEAYEFESILICIEGRLKIVYKDDGETILGPGQMIALEKGIYYGLCAIETSRYYSILINEPER